MKWLHSSVNNSGLRMDLRGSRSTELRGVGPDVHFVEVNRVDVVESINQES